MTTRNLRRTYFVCSWVACGTPVLMTLGFLCGAFSVWKNIPAYLVWPLLVFQLAAMAGGEHAHRALRRRGTHPWA